MRIATEALMKEAWRWLLLNDEFNGFEDRQTFEAEWQELDEVELDGSSTWFTRKNKSKPFQPGNLLVANVNDAEELEAIHSPAIRGGKYLL